MWSIKSNLPRDVNELNIANLKATNKDLSARIYGISENVFSSFFKNIPVHTKEKITPSTWDGKKRFKTLTIACQGSRLRGDSTLPQTRQKNIRSVLNDALRLKIKTNTLWRCNKEITLYYTCKPLFVGHIVCRSCSKCESTIGFFFL